MKIIAITGYARSGKDTLADELVSELSPLAVKVAIADRIKVKLAALLDCNISEFALRELRDKPNSKFPHYTNRELLQWAGEFIRAKLGQDFWLKASLDPLRNYDGTVVIPDVRLPFEADWLRSQFPGDCTVVRVHRPGVGPANSHSTELGVDKVVPDFQFSNDGSIRGIALWAQAFVEQRRFLP